MIISGLRTDPLDTSTLIDQIRHPSCGALVSFEGITRSTGSGLDVVSLEYEAYESRANTQLRALAEDAVEKWALHGVVAVHRTGNVPVGEAGVLVAVTSPHRDAAFEACRYLIDTIKDEVAIWKKEIYSDGTSRWVGLERMR